MKQIKGQQSIFDFLQEKKETVIPDVSTVPTVAVETEKLEYGYRGCEGCSWYNKLDAVTRKPDNRCYWARSNDRPNKRVDYTYPECDGDGHFEPSDRKIPRMCGNCRWANLFHFKSKEKYEQLKRYPGDYVKGNAEDPVEDENIYCTHRLGSLNRRTAYKDLEWPGFGVGHWHRQHEWDTCDRWEPEYPERWKK